MNKGSQLITREAKVVKIGLNVIHVVVECPLRTTQNQCHSQAGKKAYTIGFHIVVCVQRSGHYCGILVTSTYLYFVQGNIMSLKSE